jgi:hypothetical protein
LVPLTAKQVRFDDQTGLSASKWGVVPDLDLLASFLHDLHHENDVSGMVPGGLNGRVPVPPEKRFLIHISFIHPSIIHFHSFIPPYVNNH